MSHSPKEILNRADLYAGEGFQLSNGCEETVQLQPVPSSIDTHLCMNALSRLMIALPENERCLTEIEWMADYLSEHHRFELARDHEIVQRAESALTAYWRFLQWHRHGVVLGRIECRFEFDMNRIDAADRVRSAREALSRMVLRPLKDCRIRIFQDGTGIRLQLNLIHSIDESEVSAETPGDQGDETRSGLPALP